jgi:DNA-binding XRE family transcriptional regulator
MSDDTKTNFDRYLDEQLADPEFRARFEAASQAWDVALQLAALRRSRGLTQAEVAQRLGTKQQNISRLENPAYTGHSLTMIRRYVEALDGVLEIRVLPRRTAST